MKKLFTLFALMLVCIGHAFADFMVDGILYQTQGNEAEVTYSKSYSGSIVIPSTVNYNYHTYSVTSIGNKAFYDCSGLTSVTIPKSVRSIGDYAFNGCSSLTSVTFQSTSIRSIGSSAFYGCSGLTSINIPNGVTRIESSTFSSCSGLTSVTIPNSVTSIGESAFKGCSGLTSVNIPNSVTSIESSTFRDCSGLTSVTIPNSVTSLGMYAFSGCSGLTSVTIPNSVTYIGAASFSYCSGLTSINVQAGNTKYNSRENCNAIIETASNTLIAGCKNTVIPSSVTSIDYAFYGCSGLTSVTIPNSVTTIGEYAFCGCSGLTSVTIPNSVTSIGENAFSGCSGLTSVTIPNSVTSIGTYAFWGCSGLTSITIPNSVTMIGSGTFDGCYNVEYFEYDSNIPIYYSLGKYDYDDLIKSFRGKLKTLVIGNHVTELSYKKIVEKGDFANCINLTTVTIGSGLVGIPGGTFSCCSDVKDLIYAEGCTTALWTGLSSAKYITIPNSVTSIPENAFYNFKDLAFIIIPNSVTSIGNKAFYGCSGLTSVTIPNSVTSLGSYAFEECSGLTSVTIGNSVTNIGVGTFNGCSGLTSVTIGSNVTSIGRFAFARCSRLNTITSLAVLPPVCNEEAFDSDCYKTATLYVPNTNNVILRYKYDNVWGKFLNILEIGATGVDTPVMNNKAQVSSLINLNGQYISNAQRGIHLQKMSNGTTKKVLMR